MNFSRVEKYLDSLGELCIPSRDMLVTVSGREVFRHMSGFRDENRAEGVKGDEAYWVYSMTKPLTCACALRLIEDGKLDLADAVCEYLPAFSKYPSMTIEHLMSMRGGLDYDLNTPAIRACGPDASTLDMVNAIAEKPLCFAPGTDFQYSLCHDVLAGVIEVASGMRFSEYMSKIIFEPLGMEHSGFHLTKWQTEHMCAQYEMNAEQNDSLLIDKLYNNYELNRNYESGGAGLITTVEDYSKFASAMAMGGSGIIGKPMIDLWRARLLTGKAKSTFDSLIRTGYNYALGVRVLVDDAESKSPLGEFGWDGAAGAYTIMDPKNEVAVVFAMHVRNCGIVYSTVHPTLRDLAYEALEL